jgi:hypothetical protein
VAAVGQGRGINNGGGQKFGRKSKGERPPASPSAMRSRGGGGAPELTEKVGEEGGGRVALIRRGGWGGLKAPGARSNGTGAAHDSVCDRLDYSVKFEWNSNFKPRSN